MNTMRTAALLAATALLVPACGGGSGGGGSSALVLSEGAALPDSPFILDGPAGVRAIRCRGGNGMAGAGGAGGNILVDQRAGSDLRLLSAGAVDASFPVPSGPVDLGPNPRTVSADTALDIGGGMETDVTYIIGDDGASPATGLHVQAGAMLTLAANFDLNTSPSTLEEARLVFTHGVLVEGTLTTDRRSGYVQTFRSNLRLTCADFVVAEGGAVSIPGIPEPSFGSGGTCVIASSGRVWVAGLIETVGAAQDSGGFGGQIELTSGAYGIYVTGTVDASGGEGSAGTGGPGGGVRFFNSANAGAFAGGGLFISGSVVSRGGHGTGGGGDSGFFWVENTDSDGPFAISGTVDCSGGNALFSGNGGDGWSPTFCIRVITRGGHFRASGVFRARGGDGAGGGNGGNGGEIQLNADNNANDPGAIGLFLGADIDASGGDGAVGGMAGQFVSFTNANFQGALVQPGRSPTLLVGYSIIDGSGGNGSTAGGAAGTCTVQAIAGSDPGDNPWIGDLYNEVPLAVRGGNSSAGAGGAGGTLLMRMSSATGAHARFDRQFRNAASLTTRGGDGATNGGAGGSITVFNRFRVVNTGSLVASGGQAGTGTGGAGAAVALGSDGDTENRAEVLSDGGRATIAGGTGGNGGAIHVHGKRTTHVGTIASRGGAGHTAVGGNGGRVDLTSWDALPTAPGGLVTVQGGAGAPAGAHGRHFLDGFEQALLGGVILY